MQMYRWRWECCAASHGSTALPEMLSGMPASASADPDATTVYGCKSVRIPQEVSSILLASDVPLICMVLLHTLSAKFKMQGQCSVAKDDTHSCGRWLAIHGQTSQ